MFVGGFQFRDLWQAWITISIFLIFQCLVYKPLWNAASQHSQYQYQCLSTSTYIIWVLHPIDTECILVSLARATTIALILGLQHFSKAGHEGCLQQCIKTVQKTRLDKVLTIIKVYMLRMILYKEKVSVYCVLYIVTNVFILLATELPATFVCWKRLFTASSRSTEALWNWGYKDLAQCTNLPFCHLSLLCP